MQPSIRKTRKRGSGFARLAALSALLTLIALALPGVAWAAAPTITSIAPLSGPVGSTVKITGTSFGATPAVTFWPNKAVPPGDVSVNPAGTEILAKVPTGAHTGPIDVTTTDGTATSAASFVVTATDEASIDSFSPSGGAVGISVTINGTNFTGATEVKFNTTVATTWTIVSSLEITATVPTGATTGKISVKTPVNTATSASDFTVTGVVPTITSFTPTSGPVGTTVTINGTGLSDVTIVRFNTTDQTTFTVNPSGTQITAKVPTGATSGLIYVVAPGGTGSSSGATPSTFTVTTAAAPTITGFSPMSGPPGTLVVITGTNFLAASAVTFGNKAAADFTVDSATQISATVANGTQTGKITVTTPAGTATSAADFTIAASGTPTISSFTPSQGPVGQLVTINGTNFTGVTQVKFNLTAASSFTIVNSTQITATVAAGTTTGYISVTNASGTGTSATKFTVPGTPEITSFSPASGPVGTVVTINGNNLTGTTAVKFNNKDAASFTVDNTNKITAVVAAGTTTGKITVTTPNGTNASATDFAVVNPEITSFDPVKGPWGTAVIITGTSLTGATAVKFGTTNAASFTVNSDTQITATVANGTVTGTISVTLPSGTIQSAEVFAVKHLRSISLSLGGVLNATGAIVVTDGTTTCGQLQPVKIKRRTADGWKTIATGYTTAAGTYSIRLANKDGKYQAFAMRTELGNGDICAKAKSAVAVA